MPAAPDERSLVRSAQAGSLEAFNELVERYQSFLYRIALRMLGDEDDAADAAQAAWIMAFRKFGGYRGGSLAAWLARVVVNTCYDELRRRHRRREVSWLGLRDGAEPIEPDSWLADPAPGVEATAEAHDFERSLERDLLALPSVYRLALILVDVEGLTYEEAASAAGVPVGTVRSRLARARTALRQRMQESGDGQPPRPDSHISVPRHAGMRVT